MSTSLPVVAKVPDSITLSMPSDRLTFLDGLRGLAALYVMFSHARNLLWINFTEEFGRHPEQYGFAGQLLSASWFSLYFAHQAVVFFFVLSGFVIHLRYAQILRQDRLTASKTSFDWRGFFSRRFWRIYPVLILAIVVTYVLDAIGRSRGYTIYSQTTPYNFINQLVGSDHSFRTFLGTSLLWPNTADWGTNGPLWSLRTEWWFYLLYPPIWWLLRRSMRGATALVFGLYILTFIPDLWPPNTVLAGLQLVFASFPAWWLGALLAEVYVRQRNRIFIRVSRLVALFPVLIFATIFMLYWNVPNQFIDMLWAIGFSAIIAGCFAWRSRQRSLKWLERLKPLGDISYSLYALHHPILALMGGWLMSQSAIGILPKDANWAVVGSVVCLLAGYMAHRLFERPIQNWRKKRKPLKPTV
jgi:peptidoglycan/LPS O-acetylase OafA/YrhL